MNLAEHSSPRCTGSWRPSYRRHSRLRDLVRGKVYRKTPRAPLMIPSGAVLVPGSRPAPGEFAEKNGVSLYTPVIVKYRDEKTDASTMLEEALR